MDSFFIAIYNFFEKRRGIMWLSAIISFLLFGYFASRIRLEEDITRILPHEKKLDKQQQLFLDSKFSEKLSLTLSQKDTTKEADPDKLTAFADTFTQILKTKLAPYIKSMEGAGEDSAAMNLMQSIQSDLPIYLSEKDYAAVDSQISPEKIKQQLAWDYNNLVSPAGLILKKTIAQDPAGISWIGIKKLQHLKVDERFDLYNGYVMTKDRRNLLLFVSPANPPNATGKNAVFFRELNKVLDSLQNKFPDVSASYFGAAAVSVGNAEQLRADTLLTQGITLAILVIFIGFYFRKKRAPVLIMMPVLFGGLFSLALVYFIKGHISVVALGAGSIVLGIAVNYSLHIFNHHRHLPDMRGVIADVASPMTIGSFTTIGGFLCLLLVPSPLLNDLGLFAAFSLIGATLFSLIFLPHWIVGRNKTAHHATHEHHLSWIDKISAYHPEKNKYLVSGIFLLTIVFFFTARKVSFENDMLRMNFMSPKLHEAEKKFNDINAYAAQSLFIVAEGNSLEDALENNESIFPSLEQLQQQGIIKKISGVSELLLSTRKQQERINRWNSYWTEDRKKQLLADVQREGIAYGFKPTAFTQFEQFLSKTYTPAPPQSLDIMKAGVLNNYITEKNGRVSVVTLVKIDPQQKGLLHNALDSRPNITILDKQQAANSLVKEINNEFNNIAWMTSLLVFLALWISYGRIELTLITFIPMAISWIWILGLMGIFDIKFNIVNIILSTFIFGLGDDYSIFIMDGLLQQYKTGKTYISSFKSSIFLSAITTILGLGILIFAKHPALRSIAVISILGICCVVLTSQVLIPFLFNWLITNRVAKGRPPWTFFGWLKTVFAFTYFTLGSYIAMLCGFILIKLNPFNKKGGKYIYHIIVSKFTWSLLYIMGNVKKVFLNPQNENFKKPALIISNHQSVLDILVTTALNPKIILLTNQWVWRSPVFGVVVRMAEYYPVADGVEGSVDKLKEKIKDGYSIAIYPEGTRSADGKIKRFHKGAFYLAEQLGLDIVPVVIHGTAYTLTKGDFLLKDGRITVKYLPRISAEDNTWGEGYYERSKKITKYFREEYDKLRSEIETPRYFREQLVYNYIYKGPVLEWYMRIKTRLEANYELFHQLVPQQGRILDVGCGYGFMSYMLHFLSGDREITGIDFDDEKIATANKNYLKDDKLQFICADVVQYPYDRRDAFIISDVLHYLQPDEQETVLKNCINNLNENGIIIVRDGDAELQERHKGTALTEFFSTKAIGFNKTSGKPLSFITSTRVKEIAAKYGATVEMIDNTRYTSNVIFIIRRQQAHAITI